MKKPFWLVNFVAAALTLSGCNQAQEPEFPAEIVGKWAVSEGASNSKEACLEEEPKRVWTISPTEIEGYELYATPIKKPKKMESKEGVQWNIYAITSIEGNVAVSAMYFSKKIDNSIEVSFPSWSEKVVVLNKCMDK